MVVRCRSIGLTLLFSCNPFEFKINNEAGYDVNVLCGTGILYEVNGIFSSVVSYVTLMQ